MVSCACVTRPIELKYNCDQSFCLNCSHRRKKRLRKRLLPFLDYHKNNSQYKWRFLTFSPRNYKNYEQGQKEIRKGWNKFIRRKYVSERIEGSFYVIEVTESGKGWNFHIHAIIYSRHLDNVFRGHCKYCNQNYLKYNRNSKEFYCANRNCNKLYEDIPSDSKLQKEFSEALGRTCKMVDISQASSPKRVLNYMLKYITQEKQSFSSAETYAYHISKTYKFRQINSSGKFYDFKKKISKHSFLSQRLFKCPICKEPFRYSFDMEVSYILAEAKRKPDPPPDLNFWITE